MFYSIALVAFATLTFLADAYNVNYSGYSGVPSYGAPPVASPYGAQTYPVQGGQPQYSSIKGNYGSHSTHIPAQPGAFASPNLKGRYEERDTSGVLGYNATPHQFPFQASIRINGQHWCGGAIISPMSIITTAYCVYNRPVNSVTVVVGAIELEKGVHRQVSKFLVHPNYDEKTKNFDVAVIHLSSSLKFNANVNAVQLPKQNEKIYAHAMVTISGWGGESGTGRFAKKLKFIHVPLMDHEVCKSHFRAVTNTMICVGELFGQRFSCPGDAGGPLTKGNTLIGLLSWGHGCGAVGQPTVFTYIAGVRDWIRKVALV